MGSVNGSRDVHENNDHDNNKSTFSKTIGFGKKQIKKVNTKKEENKLRSSKTIKDII